MIGIVLAAGMGKRLRPLTRNIPKTLIKIGDKTVLDYVISNCHSNGISNFLLVIGHMKERVRVAAERIEREYGVKIGFVENRAYSRTNTGFSLDIALGEVDDDALVINGDNVFEKEILSDLLRSRNTGIVVDNVKILDEESFKVILDFDNRRIIQMGKGIEPTEASGEFIGISFLKHRDLPAFRSILREMVKNNEMEYYDNAFVDLSYQTQVDFVFTDGRKWTEIDDYEDLLFARRLVKDLWD